VPASLDDATVTSGENALDLFVDLAKAQPSEDGNKRTAVSVANSLLICSGSGVLLERAHIRLHGRWAWDLSVVRIVADSQRLMHCVWMPRDGAGRRGGGSG
jgi:hypothetical protein